MLNSSNENLDPVFTNWDIVDRVIAKYSGSIYVLDATALRTREITREGRVITKNGPNIADFVRLEGYATHPDCYFPSSAVVEIQRREKQFPEQTQHLLSLLRDCSYGNSLSDNIGCVYDNDDAFRYAASECVAMNTHVQEKFSPTALTALYLHYFDERPVCVVTFDKQLSDALSKAMENRKNNVLWNKSSTQKMHVPNLRKSKGSLLRQLRGSRP